MKHHPEQQDDEVFLGNTSPEDLRKSAWHTSRLGHTPLMADGSPFSYPTETRPWFIKRSEVEARIVADPDFSEPLQDLLKKGRI